MQHAPGSASSGEDANRSLVRRVYEEGLNAGNFGLLDELIDEQIVDHSQFPANANGRESFKHRFRTVRNAFPDAHMEMEDGVAAEDKVVFRWTLTGTHTGPFASIEPTGRHVIVTGINISRIADGKIVEHWASFDHLGLLQQLGAMTPYGSRPASNR
jgi:steroid delta-isomerase-like uncharacterized protein